MALAFSPLTRILSQMYSNGSKYENSRIFDPIKDYSYDIRSINTWYICQKETFVRRNEIDETIMVHHKFGVMM